MGVVIEAVTLYYFGCKTQIKLIQISGQMRIKHEIGPQSKVFSGANHKFFVKNNAAIGSDRKPLSRMALSKNLTVHLT